MTEGDDGEASEESDASNCIDVSREVCEVDGVTAAWGCWVWDVMRDGYVHSRLGLRGLATVPSPGIRADAVVGRNTHRSL